MIHHLSTTTTEAPPPFAMYALKFWIIHLLECEDKLDSDLVEQIVTLHAATCSWLWRLGMKG